MRESTATGTTVVSSSGHAHKTRLDCKYRGFRNSFRDNTDCLDSYFDEAAMNS
jgi:hypothetical protein